MKYKFTIEKSDVPPTKPFVEFQVRTEERAYKFVIRYILQWPGNEPLREGTLWKLDAFGWEEVMRWKRGPGWYFSDPSKGPKIVDTRKAPGA